MTALSHIFTNETKLWFFVSLRCKNAATIIIPSRMKLRIDGEVKREIKHNEGEIGGEGGE